jgi:Fe2+ transport system protein FeoA
VVPLEKLSRVKTGSKCIIKKIGGEGAFKRRILDMGMVPGSEIEVVRVAPLGDPVDFKLRGYHLSLRKEEADKILVEVQ